MSVGSVVVALVAIQRLAELVLAAVNTRRLLARGAIEIDRAGYKWFVVLHSGWLAALAAAAPRAAPSWILLAVYGALQIGRLWVIATLGQRWTTRLIVLPTQPPITAGPYRYLRHPNYLLVAAELAILPLAFDASAVAVVASACNAALAARRIFLENAALRAAAPQPSL